MAWLVIAALLLAAALQGIGYYQQAAYVYQAKSDLNGAQQWAASDTSLTNQVPTPADMQNALNNGDLHLTKNGTVTNGGLIASQGEAYCVGVQAPLVTHPSGNIFYATSDAPSQVVGPVSAMPSQCGTATSVVAGGSIGGSGGTGATPAATVLWPGQFTGTQSVGASQGDTKSLSFSLPKTYADYTVTWSSTNLTTMNGTLATVDTSAKTDSNGLPYWEATVSPGSGGWAAGTATVTAKITDNATKAISYKTYSILTPGPSDPMWNTTDGPTIQFVGFSKSAANPQSLNVTLATDGNGNPFGVGGSFTAETKVTLFCLPAAGGSETGPYYGTARINLNTTYVSNPGYNSATGLGAQCPLDQVPSRASAQVPDEGQWEYDGSHFYQVGMNTPVGLTNSFTAGP